MNEGFVKLMRSNATRELFKDPHAFTLFSVIAYRAKRTDDFNIHGLKKGQALIGDYASCGLTEQQYRSAKRRLEWYGLAAFKGTYRGTIATLLSVSIYDINQEGAQRSGNELPTDGQRASNDRPTTNKNDKKEKNERNIGAAFADAQRLASLLLDLLRERQPDFRTANLKRWTRDIERLLRIDGRDAAQVEAVLRFAQADPFWENVIVSGAALRKHFDRLALQRAAKPPTETTAEMVARMEREGKL